MELIKKDRENLHPIFLLKSIFSHCSKKRRHALSLIFLLIIVTSIFEVLSMGLIMPFLSALINPEKFFINEYLRNIFSFFTVFEETNFFFFITIFFIFVTIISSGLKILTAWALAKIGVNIGADLSSEIYQKTLHQKYSIHISRNTSEIIDAISNKTNIVIYSTILPTLNLLSSLVIFIFILTTLIFINPVIALALFFGFGLSYFIVGFFTKNKLILNSKKIANESPKVIRLIQEGLGAIRDVLLNENQKIYCDAYRAADYHLREAQGNNLFIAQCPKYVLEAIGYILIIIIASKLLSNSNDQSTLIPVLGLFVLGIQKLLPNLQQIFSSWASIQGNKISITDVLNLLDQPLKIPKKIKIIKPFVFKNNIKLKKVFFRFDKNTSWVLQDLSITIKKGSHIGIVGYSGSGKSTFLDILTGLIAPSSGELLIDNKKIGPTNKASWQFRLAYVPQDIFLIDDTIEANIAFGVERGKINTRLVVESAKQANLDFVIDSLPLKYLTYVGERGVKLSGGQLQRIGIARAFYKKVDLLIFDEATSSLDLATEREILKTIQHFKKVITVVTVSHRLTTLKNCDQIYKLIDHKLVRIR